MKLQDVGFVGNQVGDNPQKNILCHRNHTYMSTNIYPTTLHISPIFPLIEDNNCNADFTLIKFNGETKKFTSTINDKGIINFAKFTDVGILSNDDELFIPSPPNLMSISLNDLKLKGGIIYNSNNNKTPIISLGNDKFKINTSIYQLKTDKILVEESEYSPVYIGELGYINGLIKWIKWTLNGTALSYVTISQ